MAQYGMRYVPVLQARSWQPATQRCVRSSAYNRDTGETVALKKVTNAFHNFIDATRTLREVQLLLRLRHPNVLRIKDVVPPTCLEEFDNVYVAYELMDADLHQVLQLQRLSDEQLQYITYQILLALRYIHSANILHRDLKPTNILVNADCHLKVCDFNLARTSCGTAEDFMTEYVQTRWYRSPELLLSCDHYTGAVDVWSVGCIMAEMMLQAPLFPGKDYVHQLNLILQMLGTPPPDELSWVRSPRARKYMQSLPPVPKLNISQYVPGANPLAVDLMEQMLVFDPEKRISVQQALQHPYLASLYDPDDVQLCAEPILVDEAPGTLSKEDARALLYDQIVALQRSRKATGGKGFCRGRTPAKQEDSSMCLG